MSKPRALKRSGDVVLGSSRGDGVNKYIKFVRHIEVNDAGVEVIRRPGLITIVQFQSNAAEPATVEI
jgi:hypothetical protein